MSKTARHTRNSIEISAMPYRYIMPETSETMESVVIDESLDVTKCPLDPEWPSNYVHTIVMAYHKYKYIFIPAIRTVLNKLQELSLPYILIYPLNLLYKKEHVPINHSHYGKLIAIEPGCSLKDYKQEIQQYAEEKEVLMSLHVAKEIIDDIQHDVEIDDLCIEEQIRQELFRIVKPLNSTDNAAAAYRKDHQGNMFDFEEFENAVIQADDIEDIIQFYKNSGILDDPEQLDVHIRSVMESIADNIEIERMQKKLLAFLQHQKYFQSTEDNMKECKK